MYTSRRITFHDLSLRRQEHCWIHTLLETPIMTVVKDPLELQSETVIAEAYLAYWQYRADHIEQLTEHAQRDTRAMLAKAQALLDILRRGDKPAPQRKAQVEPAPTASVEDLLGEEPSASDFL